MSTVFTTIYITLKHIIQKYFNVFETVYGQFEEIGVNAGDNIFKGDKIGIAEKTGTLAGIQLHFEMY